MSTVRLDLVINQGETFTKALNWYGGGKVCKLIGSLTPGCPTLITINTHGLPSASDTPVFIQHVKGATRANTGTKQPALATYIDANSFYVDVDTVGQLYTPNTGLVTYFAPKNLTSWTARMHIREELEDTVTIDELVSPTDITISTNDAKITITIAASVTEDYDFDKAVYDLELVDAGGNVTRLVEGEIEFRREVTRQP
jgi:hypothetical protein